MNRVIFASTLKCVAPTANNTVSLFNVGTGLYVASGATGATTTFPYMDEVDLQYYRDGTIIHIPIWPKYTTISSGSLASPAAQSLKITPTANDDLVTTGEVYTLIVSIKGHADDPRYTKRVSVIAGATETITALCALFTTALTTLGTAGIMGTTFSCTDSNSYITLLLTNNYDQKLAVSLADGMVDVGVVQVDTAGASGLTEAEKMLLAIEHDSELGQRGQVTSGFNTLLDELATGYIASTTTLTVLTTTKPDDDILPRENNLPQKVYIFSTAATNIAAFITWLNAGTGGTTYPTSD